MSKLRELKVKSFVSILVSFMMLFQIFAFAPKAGAAESAPLPQAVSGQGAGLGQAMIGEVVSIDGTELVLKQEAIRAEGDANGGLEASELPSGLAEYVTVRLTPKTVYQTASGGAPSRVGSGLLVAGKLEGGKLVADLVSDMAKAAPIENPVLPEAMTEVPVPSALQAESNPGFDGTGADEGDSGPSLPEPRMQARAAAPASSAATTATAPYRLQGQSGFPGIHWNWPILDIVDLGDLVKIGVWFEFNAGLGAAWDWPVDANFKFPKLVVGQTSKFTVQMSSKGVGANEHTMYSTFGVGFYIHFILQALGKQYNLGIPVLNFGFGNSTNKAAPFDGQGFWMDRTTHVTIPIPIPKTPLKFKISFLLDYMLGGNDPFILDSTRPSAAGAVVKDRFNYVADRHVVRTSTWDITPTATSGTVQFPEVLYAPAVNYAQLQIKVGGSAGMIPVPAFPYPPIYISTNFTLGAKGTPPAVSFTAAPELKMEPFLPGGKAGEAYRADLKPAGGYPYTAEQQAQYGNGSYKLSVVSGKLPKGLSLDPISGVIEGVPLAPNESEEIVIRMTDAEGYAKDFTFKIPIMQTATGSIQIGQFVKQPYSYRLGVKGGTAPFSWTLVEGTLPPGLSLNASTGVLSGTPTTVGTYPLTFRVKDSTKAATGGRYESLEGTVEANAVIAPPSASGQYRWQAEGTISDDPGNGNGMVYNQATGELMRFTGDGKTMVYANGGWQEATGLTAKPIPRDYAAMAYSPKLGGIVLFGGSANAWSGSVSYNVFGDTWLWKDGKWAKISDGVFWKVELVNGKPVRTISGTDAPPPRVSAALSQDRNGNLILYGGHEYMTPAFGDTWALSGSGWAQKATATQPPRTLDPLMVFHEGIGKPVLIGRHLTNGNTEVYEWNGTDWVDKTNQVYQAGVGPQELYLSGAAYHQASRQLVLFGGYEKEAGSYGVGPMKPDFWGLGTLGGTGGGDGILSSWTRIAAVDQPSFRNPALSVSFSYPVMLAYDRSRGTLTAFAKEFAGTDNQYSLSLSGLVANPAVLPADGVAGTQLTFQVADGSGSPMPGRSVKLAGTGSVSGVLPTRTAVSDGSGMVAFVYQGTQAETLALRIDDDLTGETLGGTTVVLTEPVPDADRSSLDISLAEILGDGATSAELKVVVRNENGVVLPGYEITAAAVNSLTARIAAASPGSETTGPDGTAAFAIADTTAGTLRLAVSARQAGNPSAKSFPLGESSLRVLRHNPLTITTGSLTAAQAGVSYQGMLAAQGGNGTYRWSVADGALPSGMALSESGELTGTPAPGSHGTYRVTVRATDESTPIQTADAALELQVLPTPLGMLAPEMQEDVDRKVGDYAHVQLRADGGSGSYEWSLLSGVLPKGMQLRAKDGVIDGVPIEWGDYALVVQVKDSLGATAEAPVSFTVLPARSAYVGSGTSTTEDGTLDVVSGDVTASATGLGKLEVSVFQRNPAGDPAGTFRTANKYFRIATEGSFSSVRFIVENVESTASLLYRWNEATASWSLLPGQIYDAATGATTVILDAEDIGDLPAGVAFAVGSPIEPSHPGELVITSPEKLPDAGRSPYLIALTARGGALPYTWTLADGEMPPGLTLGANGVLSGTPTEVGTYAFRLQLSGAGGAEAIGQWFEIAVNDAPAIDTASLPVGRVGKAYEAGLTFAGNPIGAIWSIPGELPPGLSADENGSIQGVPTRSGAYVLRPEVVDAYGFRSAPATLPLVVYEQLVQPQHLLLGGQGATLPASALASVDGLPDLTIAGAAPSPDGIVDVRIADGQLQLVPIAAGAADVTVTVADSVYGTRANLVLPVTVASPLSPVPKAFAGVGLSEGGADAAIAALDLATPAYPDGSLAIGSAQSDNPAIVQARIADGRLVLSPVGPGSTRVLVSVRDERYGSFVSLYVPVEVRASAKLPPTAKTISTLVLQTGGPAATVTADRLATPAYAGHALRISGASSSHPGVAAILATEDRLVVTPIGSGTATVRATVLDAVYGTAVDVVVPVQVLSGGTNPRPETPSGPGANPAPTVHADNPMVAPITTADGRTLEVDILETAAGKYELSLPASASGADVRLDAALLKKLAGTREQAELRIRSADGWLSLPLRYAADSLREYVGGESGSGYVTITLRKLTGDAGERLLDGLERTGLTALSSPFEYGMTLNDGRGRSSKLEATDRYLTRAIYLDRAAEANRATVLGFDDRDGVWKPVLSRLTTEADRGAIVFKRKGNSVYAAVSSSPPTFEDVKQRWSRQAVEEMAAKQIVSGVAAGKFAPERKVTRAEFAAMLVRALGLSESRDNPSFKDVDGSRWYASSVAAAAEAGLVGGLADGAFRPDQTVTRAEMAVMLANALDYLGEGKGRTADLGAYKDAASVAEWAKKDLATVLAAGIMTGRSDGRLAPDRPAARAEAAVLLQRLLNLVTFES